MKPIANKIHVNMSNFFWDEFIYNIDEDVDYIADEKLWNNIWEQIRVKIVDSIITHLGDHYESKGSVSKG